MRKSISGRLLILNSSNLYHSVTKSQRSRVFVYPDDRNINKISKEIKKILGDIDVKKDIKKKPIKKQQQQILDLVDIDKIINDLKKYKSRDIFISILEHDELKRYKEQRLIDEAFKIFLQLSIEKSILFTKEFNKYGIKVAIWE